MEGHGASIDVAALPLPPTLRAKLKEAGYHHVSDLRHMTLDSLSREVGITHEEALHVFRLTPYSGNAYRFGPATEAHSALELFRVQKKAAKMRTFCQSLDNLLGGGLVAGDVTEFCGAPGVGKTQLGIQLAVSAQVPKVFEGVGGEAVYIDTEGSFSVERLRDMAEGARKRLLAIAQFNSEQRQQKEAAPAMASASTSWRHPGEANVPDTSGARGHEGGAAATATDTADASTSGASAAANNSNNNNLANAANAGDADNSASSRNRNAANASNNPAPSELSLAAEAFTWESVMRRIHYMRVNDYVEQMAVINTLGELLEELPAVKLVVVDSVTFHFRQGFSDLAARARMLAQMAQCLLALAQRCQVAVALMNQVTTRVSDDNVSKLVPALGESWAHACTNRVILFWADGVRCAHLYKSPWLPTSTAKYAIERDGVRNHKGGGDTGTGGGAAVSARGPGEGHTEKRKRAAEIVAVPSSRGSGSALPPNGAATAPSGAALPFQADLSSGAGRPAAGQPTSGAGME